MRCRLTTRFLALAIGLALGCGEGDGSGGEPPTFEVDPPDPRCVALPDPPGSFPPDIAFVPATPEQPALLVAATDSNPGTVPFDVGRVPFAAASDAFASELPKDADGDGDDDNFKAIDGIFPVAPDFALVTVSDSSSLAGVVFVDPRGGARKVWVEVPDSLAATRFKGLPEPGEGRFQTAASVRACITPDPEALDSRGGRVADIPSRKWCDPGRPSFLSSFPSGATLVSDHLFVSMSNLGLDQGKENTQYMPGAVVVFDLDLKSDPPVARPTTDTPDGLPFLRSSAGSFNATHVTPYTTPSGRQFVLVTHTGAIGIARDDRDTPQRESGTLPITSGAIDVIDAQRLRIVATIPLPGANPAFGALAIDPSGRVAVVGDLNARSLYAFDLGVLENLSRPPDARADAVVVLDGSEPEGNALIFDGVAPLRIPPVARGAPPESCPGDVDSVVFDAAGRKVFAIDRCDGSLASVRVDLSGDPSLQTLREERFEVTVRALTAAQRSDTLGQPRWPSALRQRPGIPGVDYSGPDLFFIVNEQEPILCGVYSDILRSF